MHSTPARFAARPFTPRPFATGCIACLAAALALAAPLDEISERTRLLDEIWEQLAEHDAFFDPNDAELRRLFERTRERIAGLPDEGQRLREIVRALSRIGDGHLHLTTRWFLPDKPPPPLPVAGQRPLFRPAERFTRFRRDWYIRLDLDEGDATKRQACRVVSVDGADATHGGWALLNGEKGSRVEIELETLAGRRLRRSFERTEEVQPPQHFAPTTQRVVKDPQTGRETTETREIVIESRRLEGNLGYIRIEHLITFQVVVEFNEALDALMDTDGLILDLRGTRGGYPWIMVPIAGRFFSEYQPVCSFEGRSPLIAPLLAAVGPVGVPPVGQTYDRPLVVLINDSTGSMSEGLSFTLGDTGRAVLVGRPTRGLNAAIRNTTLSGGLVLWHSWIQVNRVGRGHYQNVGVQPHERVELSAEELAGMELSVAAALEAGRQYEHALRRLRELVAAGR